MKQIRNLDCIIRFCPTCKKRLNQTYSREETEFVVKTNKCPKCGYSIKIVELPFEKYNQTIKKLNQIIQILEKEEVKS
ncbi:MAG: hypothetical protein IMZ64_05770 [Bacteroidetes bacterium]|nr:hypothetical protein [Bacteroidota bacterium]